MRVEVRRRSGRGVSSADAIPPPKRSVSANPGLVKAYSDGCFDSPTNFYIAPPDHPKLGKWAQASTLKYSQPVKPLQDSCITPRCLDDIVFSASSRSRPRAASAAVAGRKPARRTKAAAVPASENRSSAAKALTILERQRLVQPGRAKRPISQVAALQATASTGSPSVSSIRGRRQEPRIDTPISGRVAPLHKRSFLTCTLPASPTLCGSFDRRHHPRARSAGTARPAHAPLSFDWSAPGGFSRAPVVFDLGDM
ncbi:unnamed protein product, partial [Ectocarpus sp. 13 AM-2016]